MRAHLGARHRLLVLGADAPHHQRERQRRERARVDRVRRTKVRLLVAHGVRVDAAEARTAVHAQACHALRARRLVRLHLGDQRDAARRHAGLRRALARGLERQRAQPRAEARAARRRQHQRVRQVDDRGCARRVERHDRGVVAHRHHLARALQDQHLVEQRAAADRAARLPAEPRLDHRALLHLVLRTELSPQQLVGRARSAGAATSARDAARCRPSRARPPTRRRARGRLLAGPSPSFSSIVRGAAPRRRCTARRNLSAPRRGGNAVRTDDVVL